MTACDLRDTIDFHEDNFGLGHHRGWLWKERVAWHRWADTPMEGCCDDRP